MHDPGSFVTLGKELPVYLTLRVGKFPDAMEALAKKHVEKGDEQSALVTCDLYKASFEGWGRPHWYLSRIYADLGRDEEARDAARFAVTDCEWSTIGPEVRPGYARARGLFPRAFLPAAFKGPSLVSHRSPYDRVRDVDADP